MQHGDAEVISVEEGFKKSLNENKPFCGTGVSVFEEDGVADTCVYVAEEDDVAFQMSNKLCQASGKEMQLFQWLLPKTPFFFVHDGVRLHVRHFLPEEPAKLRGTIFYIHELNSHVNRPAVASVGKAFASAGFGLLTFDLVGNGYSDGLRAYVEDFENVFRSILHFVQLIMSADNGNEAVTSEPSSLGIPDNMLRCIRTVPYFFMGESIGGMMAIYSSLRLKQTSPAWLCRHHGTVLVAPALAVKVPPRKVVSLLKSVVLPMVSKELMPQNVSNSAKSDPSHIYTNPEDAQAELQDDYHTFPGIGLHWRKEMRWGTGAAFADIFLTIDDDMRDVDCPLLVFHDPDDEITGVDGSRRLVQRAASQDKDLVECPGALHDIISNEFDVFMGKVLPWFVQRC